MVLNMYTSIGEIILYSHAMGCDIFIKNHVPNGLLEKCYLPNCEIHVRP